MNIDLTPIFDAVITLVTLLITAFFIPWLKARAGAERFEEIEKWTRIAVNAAEMIYKESGMGEAKKTYVINYLKTKGYTLDLDTVETLIEAAVLEMKLKAPPVLVPVEIPLVVGEGTEGVE